MAVCKGVTDEQHISEVFSNIDYGNKGYLTRDELKLATVELFGYKPSKYEVDEILSKECNISMGISKDLFYEIMTQSYPARIKTMKYDNILLHLTQDVVVSSLSKMLRIFLNKLRLL